MKFVLKHEIRGRIRIHIVKNTIMSNKEADKLEYYLHSLDFVTEAKIYEKTSDVVVCYNCSRKKIIYALSKISLKEVNSISDEKVENSSRELNSEYKEKIINSVVLRYSSKALIPYSIRAIITIIKSTKYIFKGLKCLAKRKIEVPLLDGTAILAAILTKDFKTASSIMFLLNLGETLEEWTHKKSVGDLAKSMSLNIEKVWAYRDGQEVLLKSSEVKIDDKVIIHAGNIIPFDGVIISGEAMVNEASLTGEPLSRRKYIGGYVYAGTVVEEGEIVIKVRATKDSTKYEKIVKMIEDSQKLKSNLEGKAAHLADKLVPFSLIGTGLVYLLTRNVTKALSVLMVDFSCALKLTMPIAVLSAIKEASAYGITVKGGKYMEAISESTIIVFDKTGTLTKAEPTVSMVIPFCNRSEDEILRIAACLEEHFPHSVAKAVVKAAKDKNLEHEEMHSKVNYIVAHGISSSIADKKAVIGSYHFVFEDEKCLFDEEYKERFKNLPEEYSHLYLAIDNKLVGVICVEDPIREEAEAVINSLRQTGIKKIVMMTGDSERVAKNIASKVGVDEYYSEVLPEDKSSYIEKEKENGNKVIMIGDGINDSPALSAANVGIAISDGAAIAREIADVTIEADNLFEIVTLKLISNSLMKRVDRNYKFIVTFNTALILLGVAGILTPTASALLHNTSTIGIAVKNMNGLLKG